MNKLIAAAILVVIALLIMYFFVPMLPGIWHTAAIIIVPIGAIVGLMRIGGMEF